MVTDKATTKGSCLCGESTYSFTGQPAATGTCHCLSCRKLTGTTSATCFLVPRPNFEFTPNAPIKTVTVTHEVGISMTISFCSNCGSPMCKEADTEEFRGLAIVFAGTVDNADALLEQPPNMELWTKYRLPYVAPIKTAKQCEQFA